MIKLDHVDIQLTSPGRREVVLSNVSIDLPTNQRLVVLGGEGSGKTTLIRLLAGVIQPTSGHVRRHARVSFPVGFAGGLRRKLSVAENIRHAAILYDCDVEAVVNFVQILAGFKDEMGRPVEELSLPLRHRLTYALSYGLAFDTYLIDNTVAGGDAEFKELCEQVFWERMKTSGCIIATRLSKYAKRFATAAAILHKGGLTLFEDPERAFREYDRLNRPLNQAV